MDVAILQKAGPCSKHTELENCMQTGNKEYENMCLCPYIDKCNGCCHVSTYTKTCACVHKEANVMVAVVCLHIPKLLYRGDFIFNENKCEHAMQHQTCYKNTEKQEKWGK
jgi:hypothetical protein